MSVILLLIALSVIFATGFVAAFIWAVRTGQYEDTCTPSMRLLLDEPDSFELKASSSSPSSPREERVGRGSRRGVATEILK